MQERTDNLFLAFKREPEATKSLLWFGLAGPVVIVVWDLLAALFFSSIIGGVVDFLLIMAYGIGLSIMIVRIMSASERWGVESALTARKISNRVLRKGEDEDPATTAAVMASSFQEAHFLRRLDEEVAAERRAGSHMSLVWLDVSIPGGDPYPAELEKMATDVAELLASQSKTIGVSLNLTLNEYVFSIPHHDKVIAHEFMHKLVLGLGKYWCHCGIAEYPKEATDAEKLYARARALCEASRQGQEEPRAAHAV